VAGNREELHALASVQERALTVAGNGCARVLIFGGRTPPPAVCRRGRRRARCIGGLRSPAAVEAAALRHQDRLRLGHISGGPRSVQADAPPSRPPAPVEYRGPGRTPELPRQGAAKDEATNRLLEGEHDHGAQDQRANSFGGELNSPTEVQQTPGLRPEEPPGARLTRWRPRYRPPAWPETACGETGPSACQTQKRHRRGVASTACGELAASLITMSARHPRPTGRRAEAQVAIIEGDCERRANRSRSEVGRAGAVAANRGRSKARTSRRSGGRTPATG